MKCFQVIILSFLFSHSVFGQTKLAVIGDSFATGAWTQPEANLDPVELQDLHRDGQPQSQLRLSLPQPAEFQSAPLWVLKNALAAFTQVYIDRPDHSWVLPYANQLGVAPNDVKILARDGAGVADALSQTKGLLQLTGGQAAQKTIFFFSLMDICAPNIQMLTSTDFYRRYWQDALQYYLDRAKFLKDSSIEIWAPLNLTQVVSNQEILMRATAYGSSQKTCREIANMSFNHLSAVSPKAALFMTYPSIYCSSLIGSIGQDKAGLNQANLTAVANRLREYRKILADLVKEMSKKQNKATLIYRDDLADFELGPEQVGPDCLHLSAEGHAQLAADMIEN